MAKRHYSKSEKRTRYLHVIAEADAGNFLPFETFINEAIEWVLQLGIKAAGELIEL